MTNSSTRLVALRLSQIKQPFRVMQGENMIGQFSNAELAAKTAREYRGVVLDVSKDPHRIVYRDGKWVGED